ncbi:MAG: ATP-binding protein [Comamonas sp.]
MTNSRHPLPAPRAARHAFKATVLAGLFALGLNAALARSTFEAPDATYGGTITAQPVAGSAIVAGSEITLSGRGFKPGQAILLSRGGAVLNADGQPYVADEQGNFKATFQVPEDAAAGQHPVVVTTSGPSHAAIFALKVSPVVPLSGAAQFTQASAKLVPGLYQSDISAKTGAIFVTSAVGRPPVKETQLLRLNGQTLVIEAQRTPAAAPGRNGADGGLYAVYGVGVDDSHGNVWVTNTRQNTVAVYRQSDLALVKQFEPGTVNHARDVVVDEALGRAYASATGTPNIAVFDAQTLAFTGNIEIKSTLRGENFSVASLHLDPAVHKLYAVSLTTNEAAVIDAKTGTVEKVFPVAGAKSAIGVAHDAKTDRLFVASQGSDNLAIVDVASGKTLHLVPTGAGALNVTFEPVNRLAYVSNRAAGTVTVVDPDGRVVANLDNGTFPNHVTSDGKGKVYAINKSRGADDPVGDRITRITPVR